MKQFKFKLEGLLKIRKMKEEQLKISLGKVLNEVEIAKDRILIVKKEISIAHNSVNIGLETQMKGRMLHFFPNYIKIKTNEIEKLKSSIKSLNEKYNSILSEFRQARGDTKVIQNLKEKEFLGYKKKQTRKENIDRDDMNIMRSRTKRGEIW